MHQIRQNARSTSVRRVARSRLRRSSIDERARRTIVLLVGCAPLVDRDAIVRRETSALVDRAARSTIAIVHHAARRRGAARSGLSLSDLGSLSLSLFGSDLKWKWGGKMISRLKVKILVNQKSFFGRWYFPWLPNTPVLWKMISENNFHPIQTHT